VEVLGSVLGVKNRQVLGPGLGLEPSVLCPGFGLEGLVLGPVLGLEARVLVNIPESVACKALLDSYDLPWSKQTQPIDNGTKQLVVRSCNV